jgi:hypothetical protein
MATNTFFNFTCKCCSFDIISSTVCFSIYDHRHCQPMRPILEVSENAKSSTAIAQIEIDHIGSINVHV